MDIQKYTSIIKSDEEIYMKFVLDCLGGDKAPLAVIDGTIKASKKRSDISFVLFGPKELIEKRIEEEKADKSRFEIIDSSYDVTNDDVPLSVIKDKRDSSLGKALSYVKDNEIDALLTTASTGATLTGSIFKVGRIQGVYRPGLLATIPSRAGHLVRLLDVGANMDCKADYLYQFALMGNEFLKMTGVTSPKIALLSVGMEEEKGNALTHEVFSLLKADKSLNFIGNIEGDHVLKGEADLVVCDGFAGNVFVKSLEEAAYFVSDAFTHAIKKNIITKIGALFQLKELNKVKGLFKYANEACAPLLGLKKLVVKMHGKSTDNNVCSCILQVATLAENKLIDKIQKVIENSLEREE